MSEVRCTCRRNAAYLRHDGANPHFFIDFRLGLHHVPGSHGSHILVDREEAGINVRERRITGVTNAASLDWRGRQITFVDCQKICHGDHGNKRKRSRPRAWGFAGGARSPLLFLPPTEWWLWGCVPSSESLQYITVYLPSVFRAATNSSSPCSSSSTRGVVQGSSGCSSLLGGDGMLLTDALVRLFWAGI